MTEFPSHTVPKERSELLSDWLRIASQMSVIARDLRRTLAHFTEKHGVNDSQFLMLWACYQDTTGDLCQVRLATQLALSPPQVSGLVQQLQTRSLISGRRSESDRRRQVWQISPGGKDLVLRILDDLIDWAETMEQTLSHGNAERIVAQIENFKPHSQDKLSTTNIRGQRTDEKQKNTSRRAA